MCGPRVEKYYTSNLASTRKLSKTSHDILKMIGLTIFHVFPFPDTNTKVNYGVFLKILKTLATLIFQVKVRHSYTDDGTTMKGIEVVLQ